MLTYIDVSDWSLEGKAARLGGFRHSRDRPFRSSNFTIPFWQDAGEQEADITSDDPTVLSTPLKKAFTEQLSLEHSLAESGIATSYGVPDASRSAEFSMSNHLAEAFREH